MFVFILIIVIYESQTHTKFLKECMFKKLLPS
jgi:hypothetical protein